jgi:hypothetical protein
MLNLFVMCFFFRIVDNNNDRSDDDDDNDDNSRDRNESDDGISHLWYAPIASITAAFIPFVSTFNKKEKKTTEDKKRNSSTQKNNNYLKIESGIDGLLGYVKAMQERYPGVIGLIQPTISKTLMEQQAIITFALKGDRPAPLNRLQCFRTIDESILGHLDTITECLVKSVYVTPDVDRTYHVFAAPEGDAKSTSETTLVSNVKYPPCCNSSISDIEVPNSSSMKASLKALVGEFGHHGGELIYDQPEKWCLSGTHRWIGQCYPHGHSQFDAWKKKNIKNKNHTISESFKSDKRRHGLSVHPAMPIRELPIHTTFEHYESHWMHGINVVTHDLTKYDQYALRRGELILNRVESKDHNNDDDNLHSYRCNNPVSLVWQVLEEKANMEKAAAVYEQKTGTKWNLYMTLEEKQSVVLSWEEFARAGVALLLVLQYPGDVVITFGHHRVDARVGHAALTINVSSWATEMEKVMVADRQEEIHDSADSIEQRLDETSSSSSSSSSSSRDLLRVMISIYILGWLCNLLLLVLRQTKWKNIARNYC